MDPTTLVTFLFKAPPVDNKNNHVLENKSSAIHSVELLGSWDNFAQPHHMHHDRRRGAGFWSGCFNFDNIIYDGDEHSFHPKPRSGGLKQGGTYWYFFRLDHDVEAWDDSLPSVTNCPLLPGQRMNLIEVPFELLPPPTRCRSACDDIAGTLADLWPHTLDPNSKFAMLEPPPISKVHSRCLSALTIRLESPPPAIEVPARPASVTSDGRPLSRRDSIYEAAPVASRPVSSSAVSDCISSTYSDSSFDFNMTRQLSPRLHSEGRGCISRRSEGGLASRQSSRHTLDDLAPALRDDTRQPSRKESFTALPALNVGRPNSPLHYKPAPPLLAAEADPEYSSRPVSVQNVQFYGSRPSSSSSSEDAQWRPRIYSIPKRTNSDLRQHVVHDPPRRTSFTSGLGDPYSPTFSADTVSSNGLETPLRLSLTSYSRRESWQSFSEREHPPPLSPFLTLDSTPSPPPNRLPPAPPLPPPPPRTAPAPPSGNISRTFLGYALPSSAIESAQSLLSKISASRISVPTRDDEACSLLSMERSRTRGSTRHGSRPDPASFLSLLPELPSLGTAEAGIEGGGGMAEEIFGELGYS